MNTLTTLALQSRFAPVSMNLHLIFCAVATVLFVVLYIKNKKLSDIYWLLICDTTLILQFYSDSVTATFVGICEVLLLALVIYQSSKETKAAKAVKAEAENTDNEADMEDLADLVKSERKAILGGDKVDVIGNAFDTDDKNR